MTAAPPRMPPPSGPPARNASPAAAAPTVKPKLGKPGTSHVGTAIVLNSVEGWGKTTFGCHSPSPLLLMARGETGYLTLRNAGRVPEVDTLVDDAGKPKTVDSWAELIGVIDSDLSAYKTLVLDALGGFERLCHEMVCVRDFKGVWGEDGFGSFQKGYTQSVTDWLSLLARMERLRLGGLNIILLSHAKTGTFKNPDGPDYDRFGVDCHSHTWSATARWADAILFGRFETVVDGVKKGKGKGIGGADRIICTEGRDSYIAKNRFGLPPVIEVAADPAAVYSTVFNLITKPG